MTAIALLIEREQWELLALCLALGLLRAWEQMPDALPEALQMLEADHD